MLAGKALKQSAFCLQCMYESKSLQEASCAANTSRLPGPGVANTDPTRLRQLRQKLAQFQARELMQMNSTSP